MTTGRHGSNASEVVRFGALFLAVGFLLVIGCDEYNRADISDDGGHIAFSFGDKGFTTDKSSEMYLFDVDACTLERLTVNTDCDAWADLGEKGLLFMKTDAKAGPIYVHTGKQTIKLVHMMANGPLWISDDKIFFAAVTELENKKKEEELKTAFFIYHLGPGDLEKLVTIPYTEQATLFSTLPAFYNDRRIYYAVARSVKTSGESSGKTKNHKLTIEVLAIDLATKQRRRVTEFTFPGHLKRKKEDELPVGFVDLAISPDDKKLICCFLPGKGISLEQFDDKLDSTSYIVDTETGEQTLFSRDMNMYYPQWVPLPKSAAPPTTQRTQAPTTRQSPLPKYRFMYLSGSVIGNGRTVWITDLNGNRIKLADLPDQVMHAYTGWAWLGPRHVRIFHIADSGLRIIDAAPNGTEKRTRRLSKTQLAALKRKADLAGLIGYLKDQERQVRENLNAYPGEESAKSAKKIQKEYEHQIKKLQKQLEKLQENRVQYQIEPVS